MPVIQPILSYYSVPVLNQSNTGNYGSRKTHVQLCLPTRFRLDRASHRESRSSQFYLFGGSENSGIHRSFLLSSGKELPKSPDGPRRLAAFLSLQGAVTLESGVALGLTNRRFFQQITTLNGTSGTMGVLDHFRCASFFTPARLAQFNVLYAAKTIGEDAYNSFTNTKETTTGKIIGGMASTVLGLPFAAPMEGVLVTGITAGINNKPFRLLETIQLTFRSILTGNTRALGATTYREIPYGFCLAALPDIYKSWINGNFETTQSVANVASSLGASTTYAVLSHPFDVVKTAIQNNPNLPDSTFQAMQKIVADRGWVALGAGFKARLAKIVGTFFIIGHGTKLIERIINEQLK